MMVDWILLVVPVVLCVIILVAWHDGYATGWDRAEKETYERLVKRSYVGETGPELWVVPE